MSILAHNIIYRVDERPPLAMALTLAAQHLPVIATSLVFPIILARALNLSTADTATLVTMSMLGTGLGTILQTLTLHKKGWRLGCGYLVPANPSAAYLQAAMAAADVGGLGLILSMTFWAGLAESLISRVLHRLRPYFPPEIMGLVLVMSSLALAPTIAAYFAGVDPEQPTGDPREFLVACVSLAIMVGGNIWGGKGLRLYSALLGAAVGSVLAWALGTLEPEALNRFAEAPLADLPRLTPLSLRFDFGLFVMFAIAALSSAFRTMGMIIACQKLEYADWKRPDMDSIAGGVAAEGLGSMISGLIGGVGLTSSSGSIGVNLATGATSRCIGALAGLMLVAAAFFPKLALFLILLPKPVVGATLLFSFSFAVISGVQIICSRMLGSRGAFVVGVPLMVEAGLMVMPQLAPLNPLWLKPLFTSPLILSSTLALLLNVMFRIGATNTRRFSFHPKDELERVFTFMEESGEFFGARREVIARATQAVSEAADTLRSLGQTIGSIEITARFDDFNLDLELAYLGQAIPLPGEGQEFKHCDLDQDSQQAALSGLIVSKLADRVRVRDEQGRCALMLHFEH
jgi:NCS2 family nucleobase:cation symporter-2